MAGGSSNHSEEGGSCNTEQEGSVDQVHSSDLACANTCDNFRHKEVPSSHLLFRASQK